MLEYTKSEKKEWKKTTARRNEISKTEIEIIMKNKIRNEAEKEKYKAKGTGIYIGRGTNDRLSAKGYNYVSIDPYGASDGIKPRTGNEQSYYYGYYERGTENCFFTGRDWRHVTQPGYCTCTYCISSGGVSGI